MESSITIKDVSTIKVKRRYVLLDIYVKGVGGLVRVTVMGPAKSLLLRFVDAKEVKDGDVVAKRVHAQTGVSVEKSIEQYLRRERTMRADSDLSVQNAKDDRADETRATKKEESWSCGERECED